MHRCFLVSLVLTVAGVCSAADDNTTDSKKDYAEFSKLLHKMVAKDLPRVYEDNSGWGRTIPIPDKLRLPRLARVKVQVEGREELPHGLWKRFRVRMDDPAKDLVIQVRDFAKVDASTFRLAVDAEAAVFAEGQVQHWQKGLATIGATAQADAVLLLGMVFDIGVSLDLKKIPPDLVIKPKVADLQLDLKEFNLRRVGNLIEGERAKNLGDELKDVLRGLVKSQEAEVKNRANEAIAKSLREGKGNISAAGLLKFVTPGKVTQGQ